MRPIGSILVFLLGLSLAGCASWSDLLGQPSRQGVSSSLVDYLYPDDQVPPPLEEQTPVLRLPIRVGLAFVPSREAGSSPLSEATRNALLEQVRSAFIQRKYIARIEVIPDTYLRSSTGFQGMQQVARLYGADVMALVSVDQVAGLADKKLSLTYWTVVGAYLIEGTESEVHTFVDTAVFDVASRTLLFRAPGIDRREQTSTLVEAAERMRETRDASFAGAMGQMTTNLGAELDRFEKRLKDEPRTAQVEWREGSGGGGGLAIELLALAVIGGLSRWNTRRQTR